MSYDRFAWLAALLPHVLGFIVVIGYAAGYEVFMVAGAIGGLACLGLVLLGLVAVGMSRFKEHRWTASTRGAFLVLLFNLPASFGYVLLLERLMNRVVVEIKNQSSLPFRDITYQIDTKSWSGSPVAPGETRKKVLYFGSVADSDIQVKGKLGSRPIDMADGYVPVGGPTEVFFVLKD